MITYKLHLLRCGRTGGGEQPRRTVGGQDLPLSDSGRRELADHRERCRYPHAEMVYTSPLLRCRETVDLLYPDIYTVAVEDLRDMSLGAFEGRDLEELQGDPDFRAWLENSVENPPPGGEPVQAFTQRVVGAIHHIFRMMMDEGVRSAAVVTHGGVIMTLLAGIALPKLPLHEWSVPSGAGYTLQMTPQMWMRDGCGEVIAAIPEALEDE